jgi:chromatin segregation and condensation protein Rec8/ScpA/Scc1 (kleisin family)
LTKSLFTSLLCGIAAVAVSAPAMAQSAADAAPQGADAAVDSGEILVTARKRSETLMNVPVVATALSSEMIERLRVEVGLFRRIRFTGSIRMSTRGEVVASFIALLALWRSGEVFVQQECQFDDIWVERSSVGQRSS